MLQSLLFIGLAFACFAAASFLLSLVSVLLRRGLDRHREVAELQGSYADVVTGRVVPDRDGLPDPRIAKGFVYDVRCRRFVAQGRLADEYVAALVGK